MLGPLIKQVPVVGQAYGFTKTAMKVYNSTSPVEAVKVAASSCTNHRRLRATTNKISR